MKLKRVAGTLSAYLYDSYQVVFRSGVERLIKVKWRRKGTLCTKQYWKILCETIFHGCQYHVINITTNVILIILMQTNLIIMMKQYLFITDIETTAPSPSLQYDPGTV